VTYEHDTSGSLFAQSASDELRMEFVRLAQCAADASDADLAEIASTMADLLSVAELFREDSATGERADEIIEFCRQKALPAAVNSESADTLKAILDEVNLRWSDCLNLLAPEERFSSQQVDSWNAANSSGWEILKPEQSTDESTSIDGRPCETFSLDIEGILASLSGCSIQSESPSAEVSPAVKRSDAGVTALPQPPQEPETIDDPEMVAAFADDAQQGLAEMETCLLNLESGHGADEALRSFCRQLHTLKGASGTVGLSRLAGYLHNLESYIESTSDHEIDVDKLLEGVDAIRAQLTAIGVPCTGVSSLPHEAPTTDRSPLISLNPVPALASASVPASTSATGTESELFVRVEASRLERLMDLLAELVMLRNRRETYVDSLRTIHDELNSSASRTRALTSSIEVPPSCLGETDDRNSSDTARANTRSRFLSRSLDEISKDVSEIGRSVQDLFDPLSDDNSAVSHLIGRFRQELMELRRLPVGGLFQRLQRSIRDAAKAEGKQVEVHFEGQGARAERAVQERLFEPLLHLVRNAVSHGIETAADRAKSQKPAVGKIVLSAWSDAASLVIEISDDGPGFNDEVLETRGRELGLLPLGETVSQAQLWKLIFHPGFSTKASASEISGRGVGMDVVDSWVRRLRGRIDVESVAGRGTTFRLQVPLRSAIEHAMVVRAGGQLFALPMHAVSGTSDSKLPMSGVSNSAPPPGAISLSRILGCRGGQTNRGCHITLRDIGKACQAEHSRSEGETTISVDAIVGVEEVVVRSLPPLLQRNELFAGVTLSGRAETVLLLDVHKLIELNHRHEDSSSHDSFIGGVSDATELNSGSHSCILVVDDSVVIRRSLTRKLKAIGYDVREASNGRDALSVLRAGGITAVVTDIDMPGMNGFDLLQEMKRQKQLQAIPVTVLTSRDEDRMLTEIRNLQPASVLTKPVTDVTVTAIIESFTCVGTSDQ